MKRMHFAPSWKEFVFGRHSTKNPSSFCKESSWRAPNLRLLFLDPFNGSGTTGVAIQTINKALQKAGKLEDLKQGRKYIGIDRET